ncbi:addiction module protein [Alienimonas sp. DA493]|uniref:addiction module protein n=1 Tax=Alienimonas sp. DA493 TaxID=3373605 RepID=UPI0037551367
MPAAEALKLAPLSPAAEALYRQASTLSDEDRVGLADRLTGFRPGGPAVPTAAERAELDRRVAAFHEGADLGEPWERVRGRMTALIEQLSGASDPPGAAE